METLQCNRLPVKQQEAGKMLSGIQTGDLQLLGHEQAAAQLKPAHDQAAASAEKVNAQAPAGATEL